MDQETERKEIEEESLVDLLRRCPIYEEAWNTILGL